MCWILFISKRPTNYIESINQSRSAIKKICWYGTQKLGTQKPKQISLWLPNRSSYFSSYEAWKNYGMQWFKFFHTENTSKQQENGDFYEDLLSENDFEAVLVNFYLLLYVANASEAVEKISTRALLELCQIKATPMKKHI